jgi:hypothetical protein
MTDKEIQDSTEANGRAVTIDTGFYTVEVYGDPDDSLADVQETAEDLADRAVDDLKDLDKGGGPYE